MSDTGAAPAGPAADVIVVGAGLAGLVAACEVVDRGLRVLILDQENSFLTRVEMSAVISALS